MILMSIVGSPSHIETCPPANATFNPGTLGGFQTSRDELRRAQPAFAPRDFTWSPGAFQTSRDELQRAQPAFARRDFTWNPGSVPDPPRGPISAWRGGR